MKYVRINILGGILASSCALFPLNAAAQPVETLVVPRIETSGTDFNLDGIINESVWSETTAINQLLVITPDSLAKPLYNTEVRAFYNDDGIYIAAKNYQPVETLVARLSARDARVRRDAFAVSIDPSGSGLYGYNMRVHLGGSISDGTILPERQMSRDWDGPWRSSTQESDDGWSTEIFIPWSMMPLPAASNNNRQIGIYFERTIAHLNETWSWPALPETSPQHLSAYAKIQVEGVSPRPNVIYYPYASTSYNNLNGATDTRIGTDIYWRPNSNTQISATINPDFGTVESDNIVVNLGAFETFFSEKRSFFLEGNEIFTAHPRAAGGQSPLTLLNSRRIGAAATFDIPSGFSYLPTERNRPSDLIGAAKATGQLGALRYGLMAASENDTALRGFNSDNQPMVINSNGKDFLVGRLLYEDTRGGGRRGIGWMGTRLTHLDKTANVNAIDLHYFSVDSLWTLDSQFIQSNVNGVTGYGMLADITFRPGQGIQHHLTSQYLDENIDLNDIGYMRRNGEMSLDYAFTVNRSGLQHYRTLESTFRLQNQWNTAGRLVRAGISFDREYTYYNNTTLALDISYRPPRVDDRASRGNGSFRIPSSVAAQARWQGDRSRPLSFLVAVGNNQEDLKRSNIGLTTGIVWQPDDKFFFEKELSYNDRNSLLVRSAPGYMTAFRAIEWSARLNANYFLTSRQQFRMSMQWSAVKAKEDKHYSIDQLDVSRLVSVEKPSFQSENFSISRMSFQARYQWEIAPLSDLFLVYTRGSNLDPEIDGNFSSLLHEAWVNRISDTFVAKIRYRFGG